jgi:hypothetical protein
LHRQIAKIKSKAGASAQKNEKFLPSTGRQFLSLAHFAQLPFAHGKDDDLCARV